MDYILDKKYAHKPLMRAGARLLYYRGPCHPLTRNHPKQKPYWVLGVHHQCDNGDGGVLYVFVRKGKKWQCYGCGRLRYSQHNHLFAEHLPKEGVTCN